MQSEPMTPASPCSTTAGQRTIFDRAARVFDGWTDAETGARVLRLETRGDRAESEVRQTLYQQCPPFLRGGEQVVLRTCHGPDWPSIAGASFSLLDLTDGTFSTPFPPGAAVVEACDATGVILLYQRDRSETSVWDMATGKTLASLSIPEGWRFAGMCALADGQRAVVGYLKGRPHYEPVHSRVFLLAPGMPATLLFETDAYTCNHFQACPSDSDLFSYDRWPAPMRDVPQAIHLASLDGSIHEPVKLDARAAKPASTLGRVTITSGHPMAAISSVTSTRTRC